MPNQTTPFGFQSEFLGRISYDKGLETQTRAISQVGDRGLSAIILGLEHDPVITLGIRGKVETDILVPEASLIEKGFAIQRAYRGGQATLHVPGQLVIYPICNLRKLGLGARDYVCTVERATGSWLSSLGVQWRRADTEPGMFVGHLKLVAFGFRIAHGISSHGLAVNVTNSPADFALIRTCGVNGQLATNLKDQGASTDLKALFSSWLNHFCAALPDSSK